MPMNHVAQSEKQKDTATGDTSPVTALARFMADEMQQVNAEIIARMQSPVPMIPQLAGYLIASGGKRIRPMMTLASAQLCGHTDSSISRILACAVEFIHTATLLHDDVVDESPQRRGQAAANTIFGNQASVLVGDFLFSRAFECMVESGSLEILGILSSASARIAEGEVLQLSVAGNLNTGIDTYYEVIRAKTAILFAAACQVGALAAKATPAQQKALHDYGMALGMAFQLADDALDYDKVSSKLRGKECGDDFREGKMTLPVLLAWQEGDESEKQFWNRCFSEAQHPEDLDTAIALLDKYQTLAATRTSAMAHAMTAIDALSIFPPSPLRDLLKECADYAANRRQ